MSGDPLVSQETPEPVSPQEQFERDYAERSNIPVAQLRALGGVVKPCACGSEDCVGWQMNFGLYRPSADLHELVALVMALLQDKEFMRAHDWQPTVADVLARIAQP